MLRIYARGLTWATVGSGTVVIRDRSANHVRNFVVKHAARRHRTRDGRFVFSGRSMTVYVSTRFTLSIRGRGINSGTVAIGRSYLRQFRGTRRSGSYSVNGSRRLRRWPTTGRRLLLQR